VQAIYGEPKKLQSVSTNRFFGKPWGDKSNYVLQARYVERSLEVQPVQASSS
jgi:hypothetical protein